jgi:hypothetical protein
MLEYRVTAERTGAHASVATTKAAKIVLDTDNAELCQVRTDGVAQSCSMPDQPGSTRRASGAWPERFAAQLTSLRQTASSDA